jgi:acetylornithine deacetylase/succinyl-diaminopimelate desuccinylase-like protein
VGPGSIRVAHTAEERITGSELATGKDLLVRLANRVFAEATR